MNKKHYCSSCSVSVSDDLRYCPLCGKFVGKNREAEPKETEVSFPKVDQGYAQLERWIKLVGAVMLFSAIVVVAVNLFFKTDPYWFPYVLVGLFALWRILFYPFKEGKSHVASLPVSGIVVAVLLLFIDVYGYHFEGTALGWALCYAVPGVLTLTTLVSFIVALTNRNFEETLTKGILAILIVNVLFLISKILWFNQFSNWPIFMTIMGGVVALFLLFLIKRKRLVKELNRDFHI